VKINLIMDFPIINWCYLTLFNDKITVVVLWS